MSPSRRQTLQTLGGGFAVALVGCMADSATPPAMATGTPTAADTPTESATDSADTSSQRSDDVEPAGPKRADGDAIEIERTIPNDPGYDDDDFQYFPRNGSVRIVLAEAGGEPVEFRTIPFDDWAETEAASLGADSAKRTTADRIGSNAFATGIGRVPEAERNDGTVILVSIRHLYDREGNLIDSPEVALSELVESAPRTARVDLNVEDRNYEASFEVFCERNVLQYD